MAQKLPRAGRRIRNPVAGPTALAVLLAMIIISGLVAIGAERGAPEADIVTQQDTEGTLGPAPVQPSYSEELPLGTYDQGENFGPWNVDYDGYGSVKVIEPADSDGRVVDLRPEIEPRLAGTSAALVRGRTPTSGDLTVQVKMRTLAQNATSRRPPQTPNSWEAAWIMWNATTREGSGDQGTGIPTDVTEHCYYLALRTNGWELGKLDQALFTSGREGGQRYLATGSTPTYPVARAWRDVTITQVGATITIEVDGATLATFTDGPGSRGQGPWSDYPEQTVYTSGALALYTEDAHVQFEDISVTQK